jgi:MSHA pilin protein MshD
MTARHNTQLGLTLVELIISIVVISVALTGVISVMNVTVGHSADPVVQHQAIAIAEAYLEEILLLPYSDPDATEAGETRATFDDVDDYHGLSDSGVVDQTGTAVASLSNYNVMVAVATVTVNSITMKRVDVTVASALGSLILSGYKAS